ncbi:9970e7ec-2a60-490f-9e9c-b90c7a62f7d0 [Thermothielavioides terrestris]|uniref:9970e7ec-2a60-490f-9e9c-b90c7a62f7d0 n=1 Tax=Thermothielavioides terrestris TaxID=2587410 RepID=A0A446BQB6_9PEZI|nr:9970e7ec-2a60-490f-9e9c-b90c7a62f7d0 [Thermothielavioides terrestris]
MAASGGLDMALQQQQQHQHQQQPRLQYSSSPSLSSPPSALSEPGSPARVINAVINAGRANIEMDEIIVEPSSAAQFGIMQQLHPSEPPSNVPLTAAGLPRKKPGRKPGSTLKPKPKQRRPRKPKDPNAPPVQRKRKAAAAEGSDATSEPDARSVSGPPRQTKITELTPMRMALDARSPPVDIGFAPPIPKRESGSSSMNMQNLLNEEPQPKPPPAAPARQMYDPIRSNYDPIRESMAARDPYGTGPLGSPRAPAQAVNRASASPSIASLVDPQPVAPVISPRPSHTSYTNPAPQPRFHDSASSLPPSPSHAVRSTPQPLPKPALADARRPPPPPAAQTSTNKAESKTTSFTSMTSLPSATSAAATPAAAPPAPPQSKKIAAVVQQERESNKKARSSSSSSPKISSLRDALPPLPGGERSILDFGKARPGEEVEAPSISLRIPINPGETNKYVNFMRMAEERYGWDALHPRLAASRERKARIAAATAALERNGSGRDSGEDMDEDILQGSDAGESNVEMGGTGAANGNGAPAKPPRKKRNFKEDEYDRDDDFVDDSELLWEEQAAASKDGFFVYSGPLVPEVEKPAVSQDRPRRGRGGRGRGGRGGATRGEGTGRGRGGGPGSRGGTVRKPRITKLEKEQRDREKAEREKLAQMASKSGAGAAAAAAGLLSLNGTPAPGQGAVPGMAM